MINRLKKYGIGFCILMLGIMACEKNSESAANKSYLSITHAAFSVAPLDFYFEGNKLTPSGKLSYGSTTGSPGSPYLAAIAGTHGFKATPDDTVFYIDGNINLLQSNYYSLFVFDSVREGKLKNLLLQDKLNAPVDTMSSVRFLNFVDTTMNVYMIRASPAPTAADSLALFGRTYAGINQSPTSLARFSNIHAGSYGVSLVINDTTLVLSDSLHFSGGKIYSFYSSGVIGGSGNAAVRLAEVQHN